MELLRDVRFAARTLVRRPGYSALAILTLALGIGACVAIFSVVHAVLLRQLPYPGAERLVTLTRLEPRRDLEATSLSQPDLRDLAATEALDGLVGYTATSFTLTGGERPEVVVGAAAGDGLLRVFGLPPQLGRDLRAEEAVPNGPKVVVLSHAFWQERLGGDRNVVGRSLELDGRSFEVVGVAPSGFDFPEGARIWVPTDIDEEGCGRDCNLLRAVGRLRPGVARDRAQSEVDTIAARLRGAYPEESFGRYFRVDGLRERMVGSVRRGLLVLLGGVGCVLLVAVANVANLVLVHGASRREELAVRAALGAARGRLLWLLSLENALLVVAAGALGALGALVVTRAMVGLAPESIPRLDAVTLDTPVLLFALGIVGVTTLLFGLAPAWRLVRGRGTLGLRARGGESGRAGARGVLLAVEVALSLVLLLAAGLLLRSFQRVLAIELGFRPESVQTFFLVLPDTRYDHPEKVAGFFELLEPRLAAIPGVEAVGGVLGAPLDRSSITSSVELLDRPLPEPGREDSAALRMATPGYFSAAGIPLLEGRTFTAEDRHGTVPVALVNQALALRYFPEGDALGKRLRVGVDFGWSEEAWTIVGVVGDVRSAGLTAEPPPEVYLPQSQMGAPWLTMLVRTAPGADVLGAIEAQVSALDRDLPLRRPEPMPVWVERARGPALFFLALVAAFSALALLLAAVGLYGVVAYVVSRRSREIAIRMAVGADRAKILALVVRQGMVPVLAGLVIGLGCSLLLGRALGTLLYEIEPNDAVTVASVTMVVLAVSALATLMPARRASRIAPARTLGAE